MNRALGISAIVLVAVLMGFSAVAPAIPQAEASHAPQACAAFLAAISNAQGPLPPGIVEAFNNVCVK